MMASGAQEFRQALDTRSAPQRQATASSGTIALLRIHSLRTPWMIMFESG
jgi:hypothetical protein